MSAHSHADVNLPAPLASVDPAELVLLLDVDGVLAPIVDDPDAARVEAAMISLVERAVERCALVGIVTGRGAARAREMVPVSGAWFATLHGVEICSPDGDVDIDAAAAAAREHVAVAAQLAQTVGWAYEDKGGTVTIHFRQRGALGQHVDPAHVRAQLSTVLNPLKVEVHDAKQVLEIKPRGVRTKGSAVEHIVARAPQSARVVCYVGDDLTDLDAFRAMDTLAEDGSPLAFVKVAVGGSELPEPLRAAADVVLDGEAQVPHLLEQLVG